ncbi:hypothetical protein M9H77_11816 [Catharanthus roseus]|uniref:Uncharacterized protein n=1 Tax=Catharanthus roseus TaxID=4058 RepID=A0ACC0BFN4_CATRO|nr:hypothetical protein M9H77_11816 [Catharanthus roseus]
MNGGAVKSFAGYRKILSLKISLVYYRPHFTKNPFTSKLPLKRTLVSTLKNTRFLKDLKWISLKLHPSTSSVWFWDFCRFCGRSWHQGGRRLTRGGTSNGGSNTTLNHASNGSLETSSPPPLEDISRFDTSRNVSNPNLNADPSQKRNGRGRSSGKAIEKRVAENVEGYKRPLKYRSLLSSGVRVIIKHHALLKDVHKYNDVPQSEKNKLYGGLKEANKNVKEFVDDMLKISYRHWRNQLHEDYKKPVAAGKNPRTNCPYNFIKQDAWDSMCEWIESLSLGNDLLPMLKIAKSFPTAIRWENLSPIQHFDVTHRKSNDEYVNEKEELLQKKREGLENGKHVAEEEILADTLSKRVGYVTGVGYGVMPPKTTKDVSSAQASSHNATRLAEQLKIANENLQAQQVELASQKDQLQSYEESIQEQDDYIQTLVQSQNKLESMMEKLITMQEHD